MHQATFRLSMGVGDITSENNNTTLAHLTFHDGARLGLYEGVFFYAAPLTNLLPIL